MKDEVNGPSFDRPKNARRGSAGAHMWRPGSARDERTPQVASPSSAMKAKGGGGDRYV